MSRWTRRQKVEVVYEQQAEETVQADGLASWCADESKTAKALALLACSGSTHRQRWRRSDRSNTQVSHDTPDSVILCGQRDSPSEIMCKGASEMEVAAGYPAPSRPDPWDEWPAEVDGAPVNVAEPRLHPSDIREKIRELEADLGFKAAHRARRDQHAKRKPIPCGVPLLTGHGCNYACQYCYLQDWFPFERPTPTPLSGKEVLLSMLYNPHWIPSRDFVILGDACDPFHPDLELRTMEYVEAVAALRSPIQFSTKSAISQSTASKLASIASVNQCSISVLVSITTIKHAEKVEPLAPSVSERLQTIHHISVSGLPVFVFMRPLLPGASEDYAEVLLAAKQAGAVGVIVGSLRVSKKIRQRLIRTRVVDVEEIDRHLRNRNVDPGALTDDQIDIQDEPLRAAIKAKADELGLVSVRRACCANAWASRMSCRKVNCLMKNTIWQW